MNDFGDGMVVSVKLVVSIYRIMQLLACRHKFELLLAFLNGFSNKYIVSGWY